MNWIQEHLNIPTFKKKPHRWTLAALLSPILFGTQLYRSKYHLNYVHAKKLFVFDIVLLLGTILLIVLTYAWHTYDPTITNYIMLNVSTVDDEHSPITKIASGELITYHIDFMNTSEILLEEPVLSLQLPEYFQIEKVSATSTYNPLEQTITLSDMLPGAEGHIDIIGRYYGIPEETESVIVSLTYIQEGRIQSETRRAHIISTLRGSLIDVKANFDTQLLGNSASPFSITITNTSDIAIHDISIPRYPAAQTELLPTKSFIKTEESIIIGTLEPQQSITLSGTLKAKLPPGQGLLEIPVTPAIRINETVVPQAPTTQTITVFHPAATVLLNFSNDIATPGEVVQATISVTNKGSVPLQNVSILLPSHTNIIDSKRLLYPITNGSIVLSSASFPSLEQVESGATVTLDITLPIKYRPSGGTDILFTILPTLHSVVGTNTPFTTAGSSNALRIGSALYGKSHALYYTPEGDQLGRGPLPPRVGAETRYMTITTLENTSSRLRNTRLTATIPAGVRFTGKTSVSEGNDIVYNENNRTLTWTNFSIPAYQTSGLYIELGITPNETMLGSYGTLLENISIQTTDAHTGVERSINIPNITTSLDTDTIGKAKGDTVIN